MRSLLLLSVLLLVGCGFASAPAGPAPVEFVPNASAYAALVDEAFAINLALNYSRLEPLEREPITAIELLPPSDLVEVVGVRSFAQALGNNRARINLAVEARALRPGEHTFQSAVVRSASRSYELPLGDLAVTVIDGRSPGFYVVAQTRGIQAEVGPGELTFTNPTPITYRFREFVPANPALAFGPEQIVVLGPNGESTPLGADGLELPPQARIAIRIDWQIDLPANTPQSVEIRPLAVLDGPDGPVYIPLTNVIYRNLPATRRPG
jgi:hypothetical protein